MQILKRLLHVLLIVLTLVVGGAAAAIIVSQTVWFRDWLRGYVVREANQYLNGQLSIERLGGNLFFGVELQNIGLSLDGSQVVAVKDLGLDYNVFEFITGGLSIDSIRLNKPVVYLRREGDSWSISRLIKKERQEADREGPMRPIAVDEIGISDGSFVVEGPVGTSGVEVPKRFDHLDAKAAFKYEPVHYSIEISHVSFRGSDPAIGLNALSGGVAVKNDTLFVDKLSLRTEETSLLIDGAVQQYLTRPTFNLRLTSDKLSLPEIARVVPALAGVRLQPAFEINVSGPLDRLGVEMNVRSSAGEVTGKLLADVDTPGQSIAGDVSIRHLNLAPIVNKPELKSDLTADAQLDVRGADFSDVNSLRGSVRVRAPRIDAAGFTAEKIDAGARIEGRRLVVDGRAAAYGASATVAGQVKLPEGQAPISYDLRGQARHVDLRKLPRTVSVPPAATNVNADYHIVGTTATGSNPRTDLSGDARFLESTVPGATIAAGSRVGFSVSQPIARRPVKYDADLSLADVDLQKIGDAFNVPALATDRYQSSINAHIVADGEGTNPQDMHATANGTISDSTILGGRVPELTFAADVSDNSAHVKVNGSLEGFDPAVASGKPAMKGEVGGTVDVDATLDAISDGVTVDSVQATANVMLNPSMVGGLAIDSGNIDADYHSSTGVIRALEIKGRDVNLSASGTLALNDTDQSNLKVHADTPSLEEVGKLFDQPLKGIAQVDGTVTGNRQDLQASGEITGDGLAYGDNGALALSTKYTARVQDLAFAQTRVTAETAATFVTIGGQNINELNAKTDYADQQVNFNVTAKQPQRSVSAQGSLLVHPDHQEVHLQRLGLQAQGANWLLDSASQPTVQYSADGVTVENVKLVNGEQQISAQGAFGHEGDTLMVSLTNIDLAGVDALMLRPPQFTGRLNATTTISGTKDIPEAKGEFQISGGGFRQYRYDTFKGAVEYGVKGISVDTRLEQNPTTWVTGKGYLPIAMLKGNAPTGHVASPALEDTIDFHIESSPIDLGIVQGFTTALTNVTGTVQAKIDVVGSAGDPHPTGAVTIQNAAFTVAPTGVTYADLDGKIDLQPDRVHIDEIRVLDNHQQPLSLTGDLGVHELAVGGVNLTVKADDFKVIDNKSGNVRIKTNMRIAGELAQPRVEGDLALTTGAINLDPIVAAAGESAYAVKPTEYTTASEAPAAAGQEYKPSPLDALQLDVHVTVPNDLVVKGNDLQPAGSPIGLGALNLTLGGDLWVSKVPYDQVRLTGEVKTIRGTYDFQGRRFEILRNGMIRFEGLDEFDPSLDIKTQRIIQAVTANVNIEGTLMKPEIALSSTPPLEQADILALIVFNQPINQLGEGQQVTVAQRAQALATGAAAGQLAQSIGKVLNVDTFEINTAPANGGAAQLTIGEQVGQNLYVKLQQGVGDQSQTNFVLEYELANWLRLRTNVLQGSSTQAQLFQRMQGSGADLMFFFSY